MPLPACERIERLDCRHWRPGYHHRGNRAAAFTLAPRSISPRSLRPARRCPSRHGARTPRAPPLHEFMAASASPGLAISPSPRCYRLARLSLAVTMPSAAAARSSLRLGGSPRLPEGPSFRSRSPGPVNSPGRPTAGRPWLERSKQASAMAGPPAVKLGGVLRRLRIGAPETTDDPWAITDRLTARRGVASRPLLGSGRKRFDNPPPFWSTPP